MKRFDEEKNSIIQGHKSEIEHLHNQQRLSQEIEKKKNIEIEHLQGHRTNNTETIKRL